MKWMRDRAEIWREDLLLVHDQSLLAVKDRITDRIKGGTVCLLQKPSN